MMYDTKGTYMGVAKYLISHDVASANDIILYCIELINVIHQRVKARKVSVF